MPVSSQALPVTGLLSARPCLLFLGDERSTVPWGCCGEGWLRDAAPPARSSRPGEQASFQAALASPEEFAPPTSPSRLLAGEIAETPGGVSRIAALAARPQCFPLPGARACRSPAAGCPSPLWARAAAVCPPAAWRWLRLRLCTALCSDGTRASD